jgi:hypothetical protein
MIMNHIAKAAEIGKAHGTNAASWVFDGNTSTETYRRVLNALEIADTAILDQYRVPDLSGEFADDYSETELWDDCDLDPENAEDVIASADVSDAYEEAVIQAFWAEVERVARYHLEPIGTCEFCGKHDSPLVATLTADPDQRVCQTCHDDERVPTTLA